MRPHAAEPLDVATGPSTAEHGNDAGLCVICGSAWPCAHADLDGSDVALLCARLRQERRRGQRDGRDRR